METLLQKQERIFRFVMKSIKFGSLADVHAQEISLQHILRILLNPLKGELHEQALRLATELQVGDIIITKLETAQSDKCKTICTSILAVLGKFDIILDNASKAKNEGKDYN
ncbi:MAG: hypothetical protein EZS28_031673, partial [Streblomastix strix]